VCGLIGPIVVTAPPASAGTIPPSSTGSTFPARSLIIDLGKLTAGTTQQTTAQALKPYGLVFQFLVTRKIPVYWAIANGKAAGNPPATGKVDPIDFTVPSIFPNGVGAAPPVGSGT
jgi:hypothetical protein